MTEQEFIDHVRALGERHHATRIVLFGSRAHGTNAPNSDFDLAVYGLASTAELEDDIDGLPTLFSADIVNMETCGNRYLTREVEEHGIPL